MFSWDEWGSLWAEAAEDTLGVALPFAHTISVISGGAQKARVGSKCGVGSSLLASLSDGGCAREHLMGKKNHLWWREVGLGGEFHGPPAPRQMRILQPGCSFPKHRVGASGYKTKLLRDAH